MDKEKSAYSAAGLALFAFLGGSVFGAILALLLAPKPGREIRRFIVETDRQAMSTGKKVYGTGKESVQKVSRTARKTKDSVMGLSGRFRNEEKEPETLEPESAPGRKAA